MNTRGFAHGLRGGMLRAVACLGALATLSSLSLAQEDAARPSSRLQIYGRFDLSVNSIRMSRSGSVMSVSSDSSNLGFRGREDLGGGLSTVFKLEMQFNGDSGRNGGTLDVGNGRRPVGSAAIGQTFNRESYVGLRSAQWGEIAFGSFWAPQVWISGHASPFGRSQLPAHPTLFQFPQNRGYLLQVVNAVRYTTPAVAGFSGRLMRQLPEGTFTQNTAAMVEYKGDRLYAGLGYDRSQANLFATQLGVDPATMIRNLGLGLSYRLDKATLYAYVQQNKVAGLRDVQGWQLAVGVPVGAGEFRASRGSTNNPLRSASITAVGYTHFLSKRSQVYTAVAQLQNSGNSRVMFWPASQDGLLPGTPGERLTGVQVGVRHLF